jgi:hypothetical protein
MLSYESDHRSTAFSFIHTQTHSRKYARRRNQICHDEMPILRVPIQPQHSC